MCGFISTCPRYDLPEAIARGFTSARNEIHLLKQNTSAVNYAVLCLYVASKPRGLLGVLMWDRYSGVTLIDR